jgi:hypothetical protein
MTLLFALLAMTAILALLGVAAQRWGVDSREDWAWPFSPPSNDR